MKGVLAAGVAIAGMLVLAASPAGADSFTPVTLTIAVAPIARLHQPLKITVAVGADAGVLDTRTAPLRIRVKLATECGGTYAYTTGTVLLDRELSPQPATGQPYAAQAAGAGRPASYGAQVVCVFLEEEGDNRQFATDTSNQVDVSKPCTVRAASYDAARRALSRARQELRGAGASSTRARLRRLVARRAVTARARHRAAVRACGSGVTLGSFAPAISRPAANVALPAIRHVFVIVLENESASTTFGGAGPSPAPYLARTLTAEGAYLPNYYAIGHESNDNYIAMISGQAPNVQNQADCPTFDDFTGTAIGAYGQVDGIGCVYPAAVPTIASQLSTAGLTWRDYNDGMGADPKRESAECGHPAVGSVDNTQSATATDQYATRHNPFVYFHSIIDDTTLCDSHVVNLSLLPRDLAYAPDTPNYVFITPDLCNDGHDATCANGGPGGLAQADAFLREWVPQITGSPAFRGENGLLIITFDEASTSDTSACCGEIAGPGSPLPGILGSGGGDVGAVLLSPCIAPGTVSETAYNHYSMLGSVENLFGLSRLGYAALPGATSFGPDVFTRACPLIAPLARIRTPALASSAGTGPRFTVRWSGQDRGGSGLAGFSVEVRRTSFAAADRASSYRWQTVPGYATTQRRSLIYRGRDGQTYDFRVRVTDNAGTVSRWATASTVTPTGVFVAGGRYRGAWRVHRARRDYDGRAIVASTPGATFILAYRGSDLTILGDLSPSGGRARVTLDGRSRTIDLHARRSRARVVLYHVRLPFASHRLRITVLSGAVALEGLAITSRHR